MALTFQTLLTDAGLQLSDVRLLRHPKRGHVDPYAMSAKYDLYEYQRLTKLEEFVDRLFVEWPAAREWSQRADEKAKPVAELRAVGSEPLFPGYLRLICNLSEVAAFPAGWIERLTEARGIYILACPRTKEQYVGKADGREGFWGRWMDYVTTGHGGNVRLMRRDPSNYQVAILEVAGSAASERDILEMEARWKRKLLSREMGLNA